MGVAKLVKWLYQASSRCGDSPYDSLGVVVLHCPGGGGGGGGGHSGTEGGRTFVTYFAEEGVFF